MVEKLDKTKLEEYQEKHRHHSKEAYKYKRWISEIVKFEKKEKTIKYVPIFIKDLDFIVDFIKQTKRPVENKEIIDHINLNYVPAFKRWKGKLDSGQFWVFIGQYLQKDYRVSNWQETSKLMKGSRQTRYYQLKNQ